MSDGEFPRIYLRDHHAGSVVGHELAKRALRSNRGTPFEEVLVSIEHEIGEDRKHLEEIMARLGVKPAKAKDAAAWTAEKFGRLKLNGSLTKYSPLSRVVEFEGLLIGVQSKRGLWKALEQLGDPRLSGEELNTLQARAEDQLERLEQARLEAARIAFGTGPAT